VNSKLGFHLWKALYDARGNRLESTVFDTQDNPVLRSDLLCHRVTQRFNEQNKVLELSYFGTKGERVNTKDGFAKRTWDYNSQGKVVHFTNWIVAKDGRCVLTKHTDHRNFVLEEAHFDTRGTASVSKEGNHRIQYEYDEFNYRMIERYFGADGKPSLNSLGFHWTRTIRDAKGYWLDHKVYGIDGKPTTSREGIHHWIWRRDNKGKPKLLELCYYGIDEKLADSKYGFARREFIHDEKENLKDSIAYDAKGTRLKWDMTLSRNPVPGNAGEKAGLRVNDVVKRLGGREVTSKECFDYLCGTEGKEGKTLKLEILRGGMSMTLELPSGPHGVSFRDKPIR
jgi:PDZ domain